MYILYVYIYIYIHIYIYICIYVYIYTHTHTLWYMYICIYVYHREREREYWIGSRSLSTGFGLFHLYDIHHTLSTLGNVLSPHHVCECPDMCVLVGLGGLHWVHPCDGTLEGGWLVWHCPPLCYTVSESVRWQFTSSLGVTLLGVVRKRGHTKNSSQNTVHVRKRTNTLARDCVSWYVWQP